MQKMSDQPILTAPLISQTDNTLRAVLTKTLQSSGLDHPGWVALRVIATSTPPPERTTAP
jgi:hypothetical protein